MKNNLLLVAAMIVMNFSVSANTSNSFCSIENPYKNECSFSNSEDDKNKKKKEKKEEKKEENQATKPTCGSQNASAKPCCASGKK
ncbi:MAG: hypothetical protein JJT77_03125 [Crocinitomicaceae bacterium]|nr:hypothetical protein [Crocinitomicaceae bacterium]